MILPQNCLAGTSGTHHREQLPSLMPLSVCTIITELETLFEL
uniref:Uncharacterized protein n=1 Tax=Mus musculus TaxID=10090 RepID=Q3UR35_MOUSE|nr:unnamed protein product [Mus musculus]